MAEGGLEVLIPPSSLTEAGVPGVHHPTLPTSCGGISPTLAERRSAKPRLTLCYDLVIALTFSGEVRSDLDVPFTKFAVLCKTT